MAGRLRVSGRLQFSQEAEEVKHPILLPPLHQLTKLVIRDCHKRTLHGGLLDTLAELREKFWVPRGRQTVKKVIRGCNACIKTRLKPSSAPVAPLPSERVRRSDPFQAVGIDFAGPLYMKDSTSKVYIVLFTCAVTRAVHLELTTGLSAESFLLTFRRFLSRRGLPDVIYTDNAQAFKKASKEIASLARVLFSGELQDYCSQRRIEWKFIAERAAWWGGFWERLIRTVKTSLRKILGKAKLTPEELTTVLYEVEAVVNSRPLTYLSTSPAEV